MGFPPESIGTVASNIYIAIEQKTMVNRQTIYKLGHDPWLHSGKLT